MAADAGRVERRGPKRGWPGMHRTAGAMSGLDWAIAGNALVVRLLYSYMARGTAMEKRVWSYGAVSGRIARDAGIGNYSRSAAANFAGTG